MKKEYFPDVSYIDIKNLATNIKKYYFYDYRSNIYYSYWGYNFIYIDVPLHTAVSMLVF